MLSNEKLEWMKSVGIEPITPDVRKIINDTFDEEDVNKFTYARMELVPYSQRNLEETSLEVLKDRYERNRGR